MDLRIVKKELRAAILKQRDALGEETINKKSEAVLPRFIELPEVRNAKNIFIFVSFRSEVRTEPIINSLLRDGKKVILPYTDIPNKRLRLFYISSLDELVPGSYNIPEPDIKTAREAKVEDVDAIVVPGSVFDEKGGRMGYGGGFYDRLMPALRRSVPRIALAFELQIVEEVPLGLYDRRVNIIITEDRVIRVRHV